MVTLPHIRTVDIYLKTWPALTFKSIEKFAQNARRCPRSPESTAKRSDSLHLAKIKKKKTGNEMPPVTFAKEFQKSSMNQ